MRASPSLAVGDSPVQRRVGPVTPTDLVRFAGAGGDFNPLHHDESAARAAGFESIIAMGQYTAGLLAGLVTDWVGVEHLRAFEVRFVAPVVVGNAIDLAAEVVEVHGGEARLIVVARVGAKDVVTATARVVCANLG